jgi:protein deglycase
MQDQGKYISVICSAPTVLQKAGILKNRSMTCNPSIKSYFDANIDDRVDIDGKLITSQSPGTAMELALKMVEILFRVDLMKKVNAGVLARIWPFKN